MAFDWSDQRTLARAIIRGEDEALEILCEWVINQIKRRGWDDAEDLAQDFMLEWVVPEKRRQQLFGATAGGEFKGFRRFVGQRISWFLAGKKRKPTPDLVEMPRDDEGNLVEHPAKDPKQQEAVRHARDELDKVLAAIKRACSLLVEDDRLEKLRSRNAPYFPCILLDTRLAFSRHLGIPRVDEFFQWGQRAGKRRIGPRGKAGPTLDEAWDRVLSMSTVESPPEVADVIHDLGIKQNNWHQWLCRGRLAVKEALPGEWRMLFPHWNAEEVME